MQCLNLMQEVQLCFFCAPWIFTNENWNEVLNGIGYDMGLNIEAGEVK